MHISAKKHTVEALRASLVSVAQAGKQVDRKFTFLPYESNGIPDNSELNLISEEHEFPSITFQLKKYFPDLRTTDSPKGTDAWVQGQIGFGLEEAAFLTSFSDALKSQGMDFYPFALQMPHITENYMIKFSHQSMDTDYHAAVLSSAMRRISQEEGRERDIPLALKMRTIIDGSRNGSGTNEKFWNNRAAYLVLPRGDAQKEGSRLCAKALKSPEYLAITRTESRLMPRYNSRATMENKKQIKSSSTSTVSQPRTKTGSWYPLWSTLMISPRSVNCLLE